MTSIFRERAARKQYPNWAKTKYIISSYPPKNVIYKRYCFVNTKVVSTVSDVYNPSRLHTLNSFKFWLLIIFGHKMTNNSLHLLWTYIFTFIYDNPPNSPMMWILLSPFHRCEKWQHCPLQWYNFKIQSLKVENKTCLQ